MMLPKRTVDDESDHGSISDNESSSMGPSPQKNMATGAQYTDGTINISSLPLQSERVTKVVKDK